jgi:hypothetical protein
MATRFRYKYLRAVPYAVTQRSGATFTILQILREIYSIEEISYGRELTYSEDNHVRTVKSDSG